MVTNTNHLVLFVGEVIEGMEIVRTVEGKGSASGSPSAKIVIANSGTV